VEREENQQFPGEGKHCAETREDLYSQPASQTQGNRRTRQAQFCIITFSKFAAESAAAKSPLEGAVVIFDSADGGITWEHVSQRAAISQRLAFPV